ncbi:hypothetical protein [Catenovulum adriaticum]|uniref:Uncharacterized protein n=1 Tax=Catenovulum adriaticum TaxID=2984846 RepID=A0ABY7AKZ4_9ALTE|nr:hypothetical protein [Catenovulum sp. TS8]WAJ70199.1 hypothetical protein OLW01_13810 [Catenovulum sp. TS8]
MPDKLNIFLSKHSNLGLAEFRYKNSDKIQLMIDAGYQGFIVNRNDWAEFSEPINSTEQLKFNQECLTIYPSLNEKLVGSSKTLKYYGIGFNQGRYLWLENEDFE